MRLESPCDFVRPCVGRLCDSEQNQRTRDNQRALHEPPQAGEHGHERVVGGIETPRDGHIRALQRLLERRIKRNFLQAVGQRSEHPEDELLEHRVESAVAYLDKQGPEVCVVREFDEPRGSD